MGSVFETAVKKSCDKAVKLNHYFCATDSWKLKASSQISQIWATSNSLGLCGTIGALLIVSFRG